MRQKWMTKVGRNRRRLGCEVAWAWRGDGGYAGLQRSARCGLGRAMHATPHEKGSTSYVLSERYDANSRPDHYLSLTSRLTIATKNHSAE